MLEYKKLLRNAATAKVGVVREVLLPKQKYLVIAGKGKPAGPEFTEAIGQLYSVAYTIKFMPKKGIDILAYEPGYPINPLSATYTALDLGWNWQMMLSQPEFVTESVLDQAKELLDKKGTPATRVELKEIEFGPCVQTLHIGPYSAEQPAIELLTEYLQINGRQPTGHIEVYLNSPEKVSEDKLKTIIRYPYISLHP